LTFTNLTGATGTFIWVNIGQVSDGTTTCQNGAAGPCPGLE
jgi:hypothetical protein